MTQPTPSSPIVESKSANAARYYTSHSHPDAKYILPADDAERDRLVVEHKLLKELFNNELLPKFLVLHDGDKILDAGTGSGSWALDVASTVPSGVKVQAIDIEIRLWPVHRPPNTTFTVHSVLSLPANWTSTFTLIHQSLLIAALDWSGWQRALSQFLRVLKPGGVIRLEEPCGAAVHLPDTADPSIRIPYTGRFRRIMERLFVSKNLLVNCGDRLPWLLEEAGFEDIGREVKVARFGPGEVGRGWRDNSMGIYRAMKTPILKAGGFGLVHSEEEWEELMDNMEREWDANEFVVDYVALTARKPGVPGPDLGQDDPVDEGFP